MAIDLQSILKRREGLAFVVVAFAASAPAWIVPHPPMTDLPYHVAAIRVLHSLSDPRFGMSETFVLTLSRTQYLLYYAVGSLLAYVLGVAKASAVLVSTYLTGTVLGMRALLRALGRDERLCLFAIPLLPNVLFMIGILPFLVGIPLMFWGLAVACRGFEEPTRPRRIGVALIAIALFFTHIVPFGLFGLGFVAMFPWRAPHKLRTAAPVLPAVALSLAWLAFTDAGRFTLGAMGAEGGGPRSFGDSLHDVSNWLGDVFRDTTDRDVLVAAAAVAVLAHVLGMRDRADTKPGAANYYAAIPVVCLLAYFVAPEGKGFIWPLAQRFIMLLAFTSIPLMRMPRGRPGVVVTAAIAGISVWSVANVCAHFIEFERNDVGDFDEALAAVPPGKKVCALIFDKASTVTNQAAFLHFGSYYQAEKGGMVMFTFAGYPHWPYDFRPGQAPPPGGPARPRWEWTPEDVSAEKEIAPYYDYVLVRGAAFRPPPGMFDLQFNGNRWQVWKRVESP